MPILASDHLALAECAISIWQHHQRTISQIRSDLEAVAADQLTIDDAITRAAIHQLLPTHIMPLLDLAKLTAMDYSKRMKDLDKKRNREARRRHRHEGKPMPGRISQVTRKDLAQQVQVAPPAQAAPPAPIVPNHQLETTIQSIVELAHFTISGDDLLSELMFRKQDALIDEALALAQERNLIINLALDDEPPVYRTMQLHTPSEGDLPL